MAIHVLAVTVLALMAGAVDDPDTDGVSVFRMVEVVESGLLYDRTCISLIDVDNFPASLSVGITCKELNAKDTLSLPL